MSSSRLTARDLAQVAVFAALVAALGLPGAITVGISGVPITLQTLGVILAGAILGARKGAAAVLVLLALVALGLPLLSGGRGGLGVFAGPTVGYLVGWVVGAAVIGAATRLIVPRYPLWAGLAINAIGGIVVIYVVGVLGLLLRTDLGVGAAIASTGAYIPGDLLKVVVATVVAKGVHRAYPGLIAPRRTPPAA
ncbi:biotin transporter BioY [Rhodococcoides corynebacterioides]|uniref:Biotin transporter n=1 Tax=Rhodococcoides corynebacterioides TaxID=53972 RepID=A0ABS7P0X9_9NOCA|nr:biotin transporter BioY [Rhodococcus corynebacterioides]MBY6365557.1 biotin transporter BioY [Rhodococcus corynebacterioides]MBY6406288.1 biotin transporter BioY [Rhodococcus corynebacterioides]